MVFSNTSSTVTPGASSVNTNRRRSGSITSTHRSEMIMSMHRRPVGKRASGINWRAFLLQIHHDDDLANTGHEVHGSPIP